MSPRRSKAISLPSGLTSSDSHVPSVTSIGTSYCGPGGLLTSHFLSSFFSAAPSAAIGFGDGCVAAGGGASFFCESCFCCSCDAGRGSCSAFSGFFGSAFLSVGGAGGGVCAGTAEMTISEARRDEEDAFHRILSEEHAVAVAVEKVAVSDGFGVGAADGARSPRTRRLASAVWTRAGGSWSTTCQLRGTRNRA